MLFIKSMVVTCFNLLWRGQTNTNINLWGAHMWRQNRNWRSTSNKKRVTSIVKIMLWGRPNYRPLRGKKGIKCDFQIKIKYSRACYGKEKHSSRVLIATHPISYVHTKIVLETNLSMLCLYFIYYLLLPYWCIAIHATNFNFIFLLLLLGSFIFFGVIEGTS